MKKNVFHFRSGVTAILAMLYLVLFSTLALGFYAGVTNSIQVAANEQRTSRSLLAAESGMAFIRYHMATLSIPAKTPSDQLFNMIYQSLSYKLNGSPNLPSTASSIGLSADGTVITIPQGTDQYIPLDNDGSQFRAVITQKQAGEQVQVRIYGRYGTSAPPRIIQLDYANFPNPASLFNYGLASKSKIAMNGNVTIQGTTGNAYMGSVLSSYMDDPVALTMTGSPLISGQVSFVNPAASPSISSSSTIAGYHPNDPGFSQVIHKGIDPPEFPIVNTSEFAPYVWPANTSGTLITSANPDGNTFTNIRIAANTNPTFNNNVTLQGVIYIEKPNNVTFGGNAKIQGVVVVETDDNNNSSLNPTANSIAFKGGVNFTGVETLPATSQFPDSLRKLTGAMLLAPGFSASFGGNFNTVSGSIIASQLDFHGTAGGTIKGSVVNLSNSSVSLSGTSDIVIQSQGTSNYPAGVYFGSHYSPLPYTYTEPAQ